MKASDTRIVIKKPFTANAVKCSACSNKELDGVKWSKVLEKSGRLPLLHALHIKLDA